MSWFAQRRFVFTNAVNKITYGANGLSHCLERGTWITSRSAQVISSIIDTGNNSTQESIRCVGPLGNISRGDFTTTCEWVAKLCRAEKMLRNSRKMRPKRSVRHCQHLHSTDAENSRDFHYPSLQQPPLGKSARQLCRSAAPEEMKIAPLLARDNLIITRAIEWTNLMFGLEQENRYAVVDPYYPHAPVGFIRERSNMLFRQLLRTRRPFIAYITDALETELFRVRRPVWFINSTIYAEVNGKEIGVVHRRWHLWKRVYDLYIGNVQFAIVENPGFWNWTFTLKDVEGRVLAEIDRDWRGIGFELLTDAGQYAIRFGNMDPIFVEETNRQIEILQVARLLTLEERAIVLALAVSLDNDYFSRHGGWWFPFLVFSE